MFGHDQKNHSATRSAENADCLAVGDHWVLTGPLLKFELVNAYRHPEIAAECYRNKLACYTRFGAAVAAVPLPEETEDGHLHLVTATDTVSQTIVGSVSIYRRDERTPLPIEIAIGGMDAMKDEIASWQGRRIFELSGLWAKDVWRKTGLSEHLLHVSIAAAHKLRAEKVVAFGHHHLVDFYETVGLLQDRKIDRFNYPNPDYLTSVLWADPIGFMTIPVERRSAVIRFARALANQEPILWRNFKTRVALKP